MNYKALISSIKQYVPDFEIKGKDESYFMRLIGALLFFNPKFMTSFTTTIGSKVYFPKSTALEDKPISTCITLLHEIVHILDGKKYGSIVFSLLYLFPQVLAILTIPALFFIGYWGLLFLLFLLPLPAYFRMKFEKRAYLTELYVLHQLSIKLGITIDLDVRIALIKKNFNCGSYYWMWVFPLDFTENCNKIKDGNHPFEDPIFIKIDDLISKL